jgi:hypothetical protein
VGPLSTSQLIGIVSVAAGLYLLFALLRKYKADPTSLRLWERPLPVPGDGAPSGRGQRRRHKR